MRRSFVAALAVIVSGFAAQASEAIVPDYFHGVWQLTESGSAPTCAPNDSDMRMIVAPQRIDFFESICLPQAVEAVDGSSTIHSLCEGEGFEWTTSHRWDRANAGNHEFLTISNLDPAEPFESVYGRCPAEAGWEAVAAAPVSAPVETACYSNESSELDVRVFADGMADMSVHSVQGNAHMCNMQVRMSRIQSGFHYTETLDGRARCDLTLVIGVDGAISFVDTDWNCKNFYCGARAALDFIQFAPGDRIACEPR